MSSQGTKPKGQVQCFNCDHSYSYIGAEPHRGQCPRCGEEWVSPAGELTTSSGGMLLVGDRPQVEVVATDATGRDFRYRFSISGGCAACIGVWIEDAELVEQDEWPDELLSRSIWRTVSKYGYSQCADTAGAG